MAYDADKHRSERDALIRRLLDGGPASFTTDPGTLARALGVDLAILYWALRSVHQSGQLALGGM
ncbi:MAG: hypothetical protein HY875_17195 [Chloroflexi bacterium]|nr:hypothetical protein [Chloroflexota bacterium]